MTTEEKMRIKAVIISDLNGMKNEVALRQLFTLIDLLIDEKRLESDTIGADRLAFNQGFVSGLLRVREYINNGVPVPRKFIP